MAAEDYWQAGAHTLRLSLRWSWRAPRCCDVQPGPWIHHVQRDISMWRRSGRESARPTSEQLEGLRTKGAVREPQRATIVSDSGAPVAESTALKSIRGARRRRARETKWERPFPCHHVAWCLANDMLALSLPGNTLWRATMANVRGRDNWLSKTSSPT